MTATKPTHWLTLKRMRVHAIILGACLWSIYFWTLYTPGLRDRSNNLKGTDFIHFYTLGTLASEHRGEYLYDINAQAALIAQRVPQAAGLRYLPLYPPQVSLLFVPLSQLSYAHALAIWWCCSALIYGICCYTFWRYCPALRTAGLTVALAALAFPALFHLIAWGQTSALALACFTLMFLFLKTDREFLAGVALGCLAFKPQLAIAAAILFLSIRAWKVVVAAAISAAAQFSIGIAFYGFNPFQNWIAIMRNSPTLLPWLEPRPYQTHCFRTFWSIIVPWSSLAAALYVVSGIVVMALTLSVWKRDVSLALRYSALLLATVLVSPHLTVYDLVILAPAILLMADWLATHRSLPSGRWLAPALYLTYVLPLLGPLARWTHIQLSVIAMTALLYGIWRNSSSNPSFRTSA